MTGIAMFATALALLATGIPVALIFGGTSLFFGLATEGLSLFGMVPHRVWSIMTNRTLLAVPLFIYMGIVLEKSGLAESLLETMGKVFGRVRGGIAYSTIAVGALLAASTGVVGASVVAMGVIALPVMLKHGYDRRLATGVICASGTLGQIIPPSVVLIILGDVMHIPVGDLFRAALGPGAFLVILYLLFVGVTTVRSPESAPAISSDDDMATLAIQVVRGVLPPLVLILLVLGSIFAGVATPTESAAIGCFGALVLSRLYSSLSFSMIWTAAEQTAKITSMVFFLLIGATMFSMVFTYTGGDALAEAWLSNLPGGRTGFLILSMAAIFVLGFFIDFIEIAFIFVPILLPAMQALDISPMWFAILLSINLQTSFLTPPFGFSLFYLRGVAPPEIRTVDIYRGVLPFIGIQLFVLIVIGVFPNLFSM